MDNEDLRYRLIGSLEKIYYMEEFTQLIEFLQGELYVLQYLDTNKSETNNPSVLSDQLHISRPRITAAISALRKKGYVEAVTSDEDRRKVFVSITDEGRRFLEGKREKVVDSFQEFIQNIGQENTLELIRIVDLTAEIMKNKKG